ncbi:MAG: choice-of-anchor Q domain-containing protein [Ardenticatenaceae bacterium]|nr:choice-of-anchor Q domain-containing protein [Ardenticatenaceae bacterium]
MEKEIGGRRIVRRSLILLAILFPLLTLSALMHTIRVQANPTGPNATFTVNSPLDATDANPGDGVCETGSGNGICTLRAAIQEANIWPGADTITLPAMTLYLTMTGNYDDDVAAWGDLDIIDDLTINGIDTLTSIVDGNHLDRIFEIRAGSQVHFNQLTIQNGLATDQGTNVSQGAAIYNGFGTLTVTNVVFSDNLALRGGAIANEGSLATLVVSNTHFISNTASYGGAIYLHFSYATISHCVIEENISTGGGGGGIYGWGGVMTITDCRIENNQVEIFGSGGGIGHNSGSSMGELFIINTIISGNVAYGGGGIQNSKPMVVQDSQFRHNIASGNGGGILSADTTLITNTLIADNEAGAVGGGIAGDVSLSQSTVQNNFAGGDGGGLYAIQGQSWLTATAVISNVATNRGGGIYISENLNLINATISGNEAGTQGGAIYQTSPIAGGILNLTNSSLINNVAPDTGGLFHNNRGEVHIWNSIIADNSHFNCRGTQGIISEGHNLVDRSDCPFNQPTDWQEADPHLGPLQDNGGNVLTHALLPFSPAVDTADNNACPGTDHRGIARPIDATDKGTPRCDIGAYEYDGSNAWLNITGATVWENLDGTPVTITIPVQLWVTQTQTVTVSYASTSGTATIPDDYQSISGSLTFPPGNLVQTIDVVIYSNLPQEDIEYFYINLTTPTNAAIRNNQAIITIHDTYKSYFPIINDEP